MFSEQMGFGLSQEYLDLLAANAVRKVMVQTPEDILEQAKPDIMSRYDMIGEISPPTWKDTIILLLSALAIMGVSYITHLLSKKFFRIS